MKKTLLLSLAASSLLLAGGTITPVAPHIEAATPAPTPTKEVSLFNDTTFSGEIRARYESADDSVNKEANSFTTRFVLSAKTNLLGIEGLSAFGQLTSVNNFGFDNYAPEMTGYALIADPQNARVTQSYLEYTLGATHLRAGRQMLNYDDQRFIGAVGWRQMPQTFTGYSIDDHSIKDLDLMATYLTQRHGIMDTLSGSMKTLLLHANYKVMPALQLTGYGYLIGSSGDTYGLMAKGKTGIISYIAEAATQQDASLENKSAGKPTVDAMYYRLDVTGKYSGFILGAAYESLGEADGESHGFTTPLATLHKWQGFSDVFLGYTAGSTAFGLNDAYVKVGYATPSFGKLLGIYHDFSAQSSLPGTTDDAGSELDLLYAYKFTKNLNVLAKAALFSGASDSVIGAAANDVTKYWVQADYTF